MHDLTDPFPSLGRGEEVFLSVAGGPQIKARISESSPERRTVTCEVPLADELAVASFPEGGVLVAYHHSRAGLMSVPLKLDRLEGKASAVFTVLEGSVRVQRREYFRITDPAIGCRVTRKDRAAPRPEDFRVVDLSGDGIGLAAKTPGWNTGETVSLDLDLAGKQVTAAATVVRVVPDVPRKGELLVGMRFAGIPAGQRALVMSYVFTEQTRRGK